MAYEVRVSSIKEFKIDGKSVYYKEFSFMYSAWRNLGTKKRDGLFIGTDGNEYSGSNEAEVLSDMYDAIVKGKWFARATIRFIGCEIRIRFF